MSEQDYEKIYQFINGELDKAEQFAFEQQLQKDPELAKEVQFHRELAQGINLAGDQELKATIAQAAQSSGQVEATPAKGRRIPLWGRRRLSIAASLLVLILAGYFLLSDTGPNAELYAAYFSPDVAALEAKLDDLELVGMAIPDQERRANLKPALELVQQQSYGAAAQALTWHLEKYPQDEAALYFLGMSRMEQHQFEQAVRAFERLEELPTNVYTETTDWYLGLAYLRMSGKEVLAREQFVAIAADPVHPYVDQATAILKAW
ncbi:MAG: hypothetical protein KDC44_04745 [Phaeodactylibacter sp.]|nr:hypothetical protein [Phaeodactylibacter sp.]